MSINTVLKIMVIGYLDPIHYEAASFDDSMFTVLCLGPVSVGFSRTTVYMGILHNVL